jgi:membrane-bound ClpP family serine protease
MCHLIFFLPVFTLPVFLLFPFKTALVIYLIICGISFFIYYKIFRAMRMKPRNGKRAMLGETCCVIQEIAPEGKIQYATEIWNALTKGDNFSKGEKVIISGFHWGLRLVVEKVPTKEIASPYLKDVYGRGTKK